MPTIYFVFTAFTVVACVALSVLVLLLLRENRRLNAFFSEALEGVGSTGLVAGERPPALDLLARKPADDSNPLDFADGRRATILLLTNGSCESCAFSLPYFNALAESWAAQAVVAAEIQIDAASPETLAHPGSSVLPAVAVRDPFKTWLRRVPMVPAALLLDADGALVKAYYGELSPRQQTELQHAIERLADTGK